MKNFINSILPPRMTLGDQLSMFDLLIEKNEAPDEPALKPIRTMTEIAEALKKGSLPKKVIDEIVKVFTFSDLRKITAKEQFAELQAIDGVGEKRAEKIVKILTGRIPDALSKSRLSNKITEREDSIGFSLLCFSPEQILAQFLPELQELQELAKQIYITRQDGKRVADMDVVQEGQAKYEKLKARLNDAVKRGEPITVQAKDARTNRMQRSLASDIFAVDYNSRYPTGEWIVAEHGIQELAKISTWFTGKKFATGEKELESFQKTLERLIGEIGIKVIDREGNATLYKGFAASASHQKDEKLVMAKADSMAKHEEAIWFAMTMTEFLGLKVNGAQIWKMRANLLRPIRCILKTAAGRELTLNDLKLVPDIKVQRYIRNARTIGMVDKTGKIVRFPDGKLWHDGPTTVEKTMADGTIVYTGRDGKEDLGPLFQHGQLTGFGEKGKIDDCRSPIKVAAALEGKEIPNDLPPLIAGEGVWKFDKVGITWEEFVARVNKLAERYPGLNKLYLIREGDDLEDDYKVRRLTRSLIQQWIHLPAVDISKITEKSRQRLKKMTTLKGAVNFLMEAGKPANEKSALAQIIAEAPWLALNPVIIGHLESRYEIIQNEAAANKLRTSGSYPYIQEDLVAVCQIWIFGADPNRKDLGVIKEGQISCADVPNGAKVLAVRFPANYQTAVVRVNVSFKEAFASCASTCIIGWYDDILIRQDGDVDGDEMAIILSSVAIRATERMLKEFNPPVIVFEHGSKNKPPVLGNEHNLACTMYDDLWKAKKFDGVGKYANLATLCCHFASLAYARGDKLEVENYLNWMSLASTGAIISIDQVKGNDVFEDLIDELDEIGKAVRKAAQEYWIKSHPELAGLIKPPASPMPFTQIYVKKLGSADCMGESAALCDSISGFVLRDTGKFHLDTEGSVWNNAEACRVLKTFGEYRVTRPRNVPVTDNFKKILSANWFNDETNADKATLDDIRLNKPVSIEQIALLLWRNAAALEFRMSGENLKAKKKEYHATVRSLLYEHACQTRWISKDGHEFTAAEKKFSVVNLLVSTALHLQKGDAGITDKSSQSSYAVFILSVFAKEVLWLLKHNQADPNAFQLGFKSADDLLAENAAEEIEALFVEDRDELVEIPVSDEPEETWMSADDDPGYSDDLSMCMPEFDRYGRAI